jgi:mono/diheme cytochrome c family protein
MSTIQVLGLFHEAEPTAETIEGLRQLGVTDERITVLSGVPYRAEMLGRPRARVPLGRVALGGAGLGLLTAVFLTVGIFLLYPLHQGGQPIVPIPPSLIVFFEVTMLGTMWATFFGLLLGNRFPVFKEQPYDPRITEGHVGILVEVDEELADRACELLESNGAHHMHRAKADPAPDHRFRLFWGGVLGAIAVLGVVLLLLVYEVVKIPFPSNMVHQDSVGYEQGPRLAAPAAAIPVQGPVLIADEPASEPIPATTDSLQRGKGLFGINCAVCHGADGTGSGTLSGFFNPKPADLSSDDVAHLPDAEIFLAITQGRGVMPSLAENLSPAQRWDVVNHVRSLQK